MYVYCVDKLGLDINKVNVNGGAIAIGHPLGKPSLFFFGKSTIGINDGMKKGCTGARQIATGLSELRKRQGRVLITSMW